MAIRDAIKPKKDEKEEIPKFNRFKNVHYNIPQGKDAKNQYRTLIRIVKAMTPKSYGNIRYNDNYGAFDSNHAYLVSLLEYCEGIAEIYKTKDYVISDELTFEKYYTIDSSTTITALISEEEKELLSELIEQIEVKLSEFGDHERNCY